MAIKRGKDGTWYDTVTGDDAPDPTGGGAPSVRITKNVEDTKDASGGVSRPNPYIPPAPQPKPGAVVEAPAPKNIMDELDAQDAEFSPVEPDYMSLHRGAPRFSDIASDTSEAGKGIANSIRLAGELGITLPASMLGGAGAVGMLAKLAPKAPAILRGLAAGLGGGAGSAGPHFAQNVGEGESLPEAGKKAAIETGLSGLLGGFGTGAGMLAKGAGKRIAQTVFKKTTPEQAERILNEYGSLRGTQGIADKMEAAHGLLSKRFDDLINVSAKGKKVNLKGAFAKAEKEVSALEAAGELNLDDVDVMRSAIDKWRSVSQVLANKGGWTTFKAAQEFKKNTLDKLARYSKIPREMQASDVPGKAEAARITRRELSSQMGNIEPELQPLNRQFAGLAELEPFVQKAVERAGSNRGLSMQDLITGGTGLLGLGGGVHAGYPTLAGASLLPFLVSRAQKSPGAATSLYKGGKWFTGQSPTRDILTQGVRSGAFVAQD